MAAAEQRIYAEAYEIKEELGGGFRAVVKDYRTDEVFKGERKDTLHEARYDAQSTAIRFLAGRYYQAGTYRNKRNNWRMNYWITAVQQ